MSVSIRLFKNGKVIDEKIFGGKSIKPVIDHLDENNIQYRTDKDSEELYEITKNKDITLMCIDDTNVLGIENQANFVSEYTLEYDKDVFNQLEELLNK